LSVRSVFDLFFASCLAAGLVGSGPALGADCGDIAGPCSCGDTVVDDKHLSAADPVTTTVCGPGPALTLNSGVALDFAGRTIRGADFNTTFGVFLEDDANEVVVHGGTVIGTHTGVGGVNTVKAHIFGMRFLNLGGAGVDLGPFNVGDTTTANRVENVLVENSSFGITLVGDGNLVQRSTLRNISGDAILVQGDDNVVFSNRIQEIPGNYGIRVTGGARNRVSRNVVVGSGLDGIAFTDEETATADGVVELNQVSLSDGHGLSLRGSGHNVARNITRNNAKDGIFVEASDSTFDRNQSTANGRFGIEDTTSGGGTAGTANGYSLNLCRSANALGRSSPDGLCR
jgi:hypothetical protein